MIKKFEITEVHTVRDDQVRDYLKNTVGKLDKYVPRNEQVNAYVEAKLIESLSQGKKKHTAEVILHLPHTQIAAKSSNETITESIDSVEEKLRRQLKRYKEKHTNPKLIRRLTSRLKRS